MEMTNSGTPKRPVPEFAKEDQSSAIGVCTYLNDSIRGWSGNQQQFPKMFLR
jgi:hypothetical protein